MRIVIATPFYPPQIGVLSNYAKNLEAAFEDQGHDVDVVSIGSLAQLPPLLSHAAYFFKVLYAVRKAAFVLGLDMWSTGYPAYLASRFARIPFLIRIGGDSLHESYVERKREPVLLSEFYEAPRYLSLKERLMRAAFGQILEGAHTVFFNTNFQMKIWKKAFHIGRNVLLLENFFPAKREYLPPTRKTFIAANRPAYFKNAILMREAFGNVKARHPDIELDERMLSHEEQLERLGTSYAAIIPSFSEVASNIAIECTSFGRPFIMSKDTGIRERLDGCGLFIDTRSKEEMEKAIESLLDPALYHRLSEHSNAISFTHSWNDIAHEIIAAL